MDGAFEGFFDAQYPRVLRSLTLALGDRQSAEDAAQQAFARCLNQWGDVATMDRPEGWVYVVALRSARRQWRRRQRGPRVVYQQEASDPTADDVAGREWVRGILSGLPPRQRVAVALRFVADLPLSGVAEAMGCSLGTVKATLHQALERLRVQDEEVESDAR